MNVPIRRWTGRDERGASMVEAAIAVVVVFFLIFAAITGALFSRSYNTTQYAAQQGVRAGAVAANQFDADYKILQAVKRSSGAQGSNASMRIVVFKAAGPSDSVPSDCLDGGIDGLCNSYEAADLDRSPAEFEENPVWTAPSHWPATSRASSRSSGLDYIGVFIRTDCSCSFASVGLPLQVKKTSVAKIEATAG